jgi:hypothetical protein
MSTGATPLALYPGDVVEFACRKCERQGRYRKVSLVAIHGATIGLPDLCTRIAADCPRMRDPLGNDPCGVHYPALTAPS